MFEHFTTPEEVFRFKLGSALSMEHDSLEMLQTLEETTTRDELKDLFRAHAEETRQQVANLERCFEILGEDATTAPSPTTKGLAKEGKESIRKADATVVDVMLLAGGLETERYEMAVYETLMIAARAHGDGEVVSLLEENYKQEVAASDKLQRAAERVASDSQAAA